MASQFEQMQDLLLGAFGSSVVRETDKLTDIVARAEENGAVGPCENIIACLDPDNGHPCGRDGYYRRDWKAPICDHCYSRYSPCLREDA